MGLRLNLGCGNSKREGWVNLDRETACEPDMVLDLEKTPWPFDESSVDEILMDNVLEHLGQTPDVYLSVISEIYRVCRHKAKVKVFVPHPRHDHFIADPTHVRPVTYEGLALFNKEENLEWREKGYSNTPLGLYLDVDIRIASVDYQLDPYWGDKIKKGEITVEQIPEYSRIYCNVIKEIEFVLEVIKPLP